MTETELRRVLLVQAIETAPADGPQPLPWSTDDAAAASAQARRQVGEAASFDSFVAARAQVVLQRLGARVPAVAALADGDRAGARYAGPAILATAFVLGLAGDALASGPRIQLLALPFFGLLAWNLLVYAGLLGQVLRRRAPVADRWQPLRHAVARLMQAMVPGDVPPALARALGQQADALRPLTAALWQQRVLAWLHGAAALLALGALASMYARGLVLDFRAGWDSTFLEAPQVHALLAVALAPAVAWPALALPDVAALETLRWAGGSAGAPAAPWIHRLAITLGTLVVLPRGLLAAAALWRARRQAKALALPMADGYFARLRAEAPAPALPVTVLPYNCHAAAGQSQGLARALADWLGPGVQPQCAAVLPLGAEDQLPAGLPTALAHEVVVLMALNATPERESHGAFLQRLPAHLAPGSTLRVLLDSTAFEQRLAGQPDAAERQAQRLQAWQQLLHDAGLPPPRLVRLGVPALSAA